MDAAGLVRVDEQLDSFVGEVFSSLARKDQRATAGLYVRGLMLDGRRKSMQPMAARLRVDHQRLQQFVTSSPWDVEPVRKTLSRKACALIDPDAWVIDDTGFVKDGAASACVARQYSGHPGQGRQLSDRGQRARRHRCRLGGAGLATVRARTLGRRRCADDRRRRRRGRGPPAAVRGSPTTAAPAEVAAGPGHDRRVDRAGACTPPGRCRRRRIRRHHRIPARPDRARHRLRRRRQGRHQRLSRRRRPHRRPTPAADGHPTPRYRDHAANLQGPGPGRRTRGAAAPVTWRHGTRTTTDNPTAAMHSRLPGAADPPGQPRHHPAPTTAPCPNAG